MHMRTIIFGLFTLLLAAFTGATEKAFAEPFAPKGEWVSPGFDFSLTFNLEKGNVLFHEESQSSERQVVIVKQSERLLRLAPPGTEDMRRSFDLIRMNDDAMAYAGGCIGGFLLVRKEAGLALADEPPTRGRFGFPDEDGTYILLIDFDRGVLVEDGNERPLEVKPSPINMGAVRLSYDNTIFDARMVGDSILALYAWDKRDQQSMPPFGLVAVP